MDRFDAINYLKRKRKIEGITKYSAEEEELIKQVQKEGKIFGDPIVVIQ